jgi:hypothetical protein
MDMNDPDLTYAYKKSTFHRVDIQHSDLCGCFKCLATFPPTAVRNWIDTGSTALCPHCGIDAVVGSASGVPITEEFLSAMWRRWFQESKLA